MAALRDGGLGRLSLSPAAVRNRCQDRDSSLACQEDNPTVCSGFLATSRTELVVRWTREARDPLFGKLG